MKYRIASILGSSLEWYDFALYGFFSPIFAENFFPTALNSNVALINTFAVFSMGYAVRPLGGAIFGYIGDKYGRTVCLKSTPLLITLVTMLLAITPSYEQIGIFAPILLVLTRILQGLCIGGEYAGSMVYLCESSKNNSYLLGSIGCCIALIGVIFASSSATIFYKLFSRDLLNSYGWRLAFLLGIIPGTIVYLIRSKMPETPEFTFLEKQKIISKNPIKDAIKHEWKKCLIALCFIYVHATSFYFIYMFLPALSQVTKQNHNFSIMSHNTVLLIATLIGTPLFGLVADRLGGKLLMLISSSLYLVLSYPLYQYAVTHPEKVLITLAPIALLSAINGGSIPGLLKELLSPSTRYTTFSITLNVGMGVFGGITPVLCLWIYNKFDCIICPIYYLMFSAMVTLIAAICLKKQKRTLGFRYESI